MFQIALVPLDGSTLAEKALEPAFHIAEKFGGVVVLLRVIVPDEVPVPASDHAQPDGLGRAAEDRRRQEAEAYLASLKSGWQGRGIGIRTEITQGAPAETIIHEVERTDADIIVMATHGHSGLSRLIYGSVAEAVIRASAVPVLMVPSGKQT